MKKLKNMDFLALTSGNYLEFPAIPTNSCENLVEKKAILAIIQKT